MPSDPPAVVVGGEYGATSVARTLGRRGITVDVLGPAIEHSGLRRSRYVREYVRFTHKQRLQENWLDWLLERGPRGAVLLPCDDDAMELIAKYRATLFDAGYRPVEANDQVVLDVLDKERLYELAREAGIGAPVTIRLRDDADLDEATGRMRFPCALKPQHSHLFGRYYDVKGIVVGGPDELRDVFTPMRELGLEMIATEIVNPASEACCGYMSYLDGEGEPLFDFTKWKVRQYPPRFGTGSYHVTEWLPRVAEDGLRFFRTIGARGLSYVEFKPALDGTLKVLDFNPRFLDSTEVVRRSGIDVASLTYDRALGRPTSTSSTFREGVALWFSVEDTRASFQLWRADELGSLAWARSIARLQHFPYLAWDDPLPSLENARWLAARIVRKLARSLRR